VATWPDGATLDIAQRDGPALTMSIIGKVLFDEDVLSETDELGAGYRHRPPIRRMLSSTLPRSIELADGPQQANARRNPADPGAGPSHDRRELAPDQRGERDGFLSEILLRAR